MFGSMLKSDEKGFSLIELIAVMAIIAALISVLAPQFLKYVNNAQVATDITNAREIARCLDAAIAGEDGATIPATITGSGGTPIANVSGMTELPYCKKDGAAQWVITTSQKEGVEKIELKGYQIYPDTAAGNLYYNAFYKN